MAVRRITIDFETDCEENLKEIPMDEYLEAINQAMDVVESRAMGGIPAVTVTVRSGNGEPVTTVT